MAEEEQSVENAADEPLEAQTPSSTLPRLQTALERLATVDVREVEPATILRLAQE
jgi:hypothetical protein